eukprot:CAMPEP_0197585644 /NCGR_PEP_ID=MMETSP1326-20131121/7875_1 /TAXON_ID=1155430 /ORGANISM="Genus nov. species nov., Strain RCC2288" /LENGTH=316 /DNA_ID=CAMNT_0043150177 /DNA_START=103 /DNA_END=1053 /DNA_ORIENTATION=-
MACSAALRAAPVGATVRSSAAPSSSSRYAVAPQSSQRRSATLTGANFKASRGVVTRRAAAASRGLFVVAAASSSGDDEVVDAAPADEQAQQSSVFDTGRLALLATAASYPALLGFAQDAMAKGGENGILEGRSLALLHPLFLGGLWFASVYTGYLGWQWRRVRTTQEEIVSLKATLPAVSADGAAAMMSPEQTEAAAKIAALTTTRKELVSGGFKDKHFNMGSLLLAFGTTLAIEGAFNTYLRTGKLFPGPHLYAGMGIVILWAMAAGLVPEMQRGNNKARTLHIGLNAVNVALFTWQIPTGLEIVGKVFQFTSWP